MENTPVVQNAPPIDLVYTWVNPGDPKWKASYNKWVKKDKPPGKSVGSHHYQDAQELKHSLRSVEKFAPWIRYVFIVVSTPSQIPPWLNVNNPRLKIIYHHQIIPKKFLPTFNSMAIEMHLHLIPELAEHYIYLNDDCFFGRPVSPNMFTNKGKALVYLSSDPATKKKVSKGYSFGEGLSYTQNQLDKYVKKNKKYYKTKHVGQLFRRGVMNKIMRLLKARKLYAPTCTRFRNNTNIQLMSMFYPYFILARGYGVVGKHVKCLKYSNNHAAGCKVILKLRPQMFCLNNISKMEGYLANFYKTYYPEKSSFER